MDIGLFSNDVGEIKLVKEDNLYRGMSLLQMMAVFLELNLKREASNLKVLINEQKPLYLSSKLVV